MTGDSAVVNRDVLFLRGNTLEHLSDRNLEYRQDY